MYVNKNYETQKKGVDTDDEKNFRNFFSGSSTKL